VIFVDANYFLRLLTDPVTPEDRQMAHEAAALFRAARSGAKEITTSEAIFAEVAFLLTSPRVYGMSPATAAPRLRRVLRLRGFHAPLKDIWEEAIDLWESSPRLGFVDALAVAHARQGTFELATFDSDFDRIPGLVRYRP
jgi:predicted nucleic acid-binding protein